MKKAPEVVVMIMKIIPTTQTTTRRIQESVVEGGSEDQIPDCLIDGCYIIISDTSMIHQTSIIDHKFSHLFAI